MKKLIILTLTFWVMLPIFGQKYTIPYAVGIDTAYFKAGDNVLPSAPLVFYEKGDQFTRSEAVGGIITFTSHGYTFYGYENSLKVVEDTLNGTITVFGLTFAPPPSNLIAMKDDRTGGDMYDPDEKTPPVSSDDSSSFPWPLASGIALFAFYGIARWRRWV